MRTWSSARPGCTTSRMADVDLEARLDELFASEPKEFTPTRDALVRDLKADDRADEAAEVKALRRPTVAVAAVNRVARLHADQVGALVEIGEELAALQADRGADRDELRDLTRQRRTTAATADRACRRHDRSTRRACVPPSPRRSTPRRSIRSCSTTCTAGGSPRSSRPRPASSPTTTHRHPDAAPRRTARGKHPPPPRDELRGAPGTRRARGRKGTSRGSRGVGARAHRGRHRGDRAARRRPSSHRRPRGRARRRARRARRDQATRTRRPTLPNDAPAPSRNG